MPKQMTVREMITRLQELGRMVAAQAARNEDLDTAAKCREATRLFLEVLDGKTPHFPRCIINPSPHMDDVTEARSSGSPWLDMDVPLHDDLSGRFKAMTGQDVSGWPSRETGPYTQDEVTRMFLESMQSAAAYWGGEVQQSTRFGEKTDLECCEATIFSIFNVLDGTNVAAPMFDVAPDIDDIRERGAVRYFSAIVLDDYMHNSFYQADVYQPDDDPGPVSVMGFSFRP